MTAHALDLGQSDTKRPVAAMQLGAVTPGSADTPTPTFEWVNPTTLLVEEIYQRELSRRSVDLIYKIVSRWDWARFKPPVVARIGEGFEVIDGQHTAIAAATHPEIDLIPVMVVEAAQVSDRARAFVGHNKDRIALNQIQIHYADVAAGDEDALTVQQVCSRAGVNLLRYPPGNGVFKPGETLAISAIRALINRRGAMRARVILEVLAKANCAPVRADGVKAVETLLHDQQYKGEVAAEDITSTIMRLGPDLEREARVFAAAHSVPNWRAMAVTLFKEARRGRRRAG